MDNPLTLAQKMEIVVRYAATITMEVDYGRYGTFYRFGFVVSAMRTRNRNGRGRALLIQPAGPPGYGFP
jgi:hypothetical protein